MYFFKHNPKPIQKASGKAKGNTNEDEELLDENDQFKSGNKSVVFIGESDVENRTIEVNEVNDVNKDVQDNKDNEGYGTKRDN